MENLPLYIYLVFGFTVIISIWLFYKASRNSKIFLIIISVWIIIQSAISINGFYTNANTIPPTIMLLVLPPVVFIILLFTLKNGKKFIDRLNLKTLTLFHIIRIPVELVLFWLYIYKAVPQLMTFEGRNLDIISGLTAPLLCYVGFLNHKTNKTLLLIWNMFCLALLFNIVFYAILSAPTKFQQFAFLQPDIALGYFPFVFLPSLIVPLVLLAHLASIRMLLKSKNTVIEK